MPSVERVYLIGFMGSGKSTIGRYIAQEMGWRFVDIDHEIEAEHHSTVSQYFDKYGEESFRNEETRILKLLSVQNQVIISTGGGTPCFGDNLEIMRRTGLVIYIQVNAEELKTRLSKAKESRPLIREKSDDELLEFIRLKLKERELYYQHAHMIVDGVALPFYSYPMLIELFPGLDGVDED